MTVEHPTNPVSILVLGAGELGMPVLREITRFTDARVSVLLRAATIESSDPVKQKDINELRALGVALVSGDLMADSITELATVFADFDTVVSCIGFAAGPGTQRKIAHAVLEAGVKRYFPWQFGVDYDVIGRGSAQNLFDEQLDVRDLLRGQERTQWVVVSTGMFTSFLFEPVFGVVDLQQNTVRALGSWDTAVTVTTPEDIGALTAKILFATPTITNQVVYTAGDTLTYGQLADRLDAELGRTLERVEWKVPMLQADLALAPDDALRKYRVVFAQGKGVSWPQAQSFNAQQQIEVTNVQRWIRENLR
jgi:hypothetical protein